MGVIDISIMTHFASVFTFLLVFVMAFALLEIRWIALSRRFIDGRAYNDDPWDVVWRLGLGKLQKVF